MKKTLSTIALATVLLFGSTFANAGIIIAGAPAQDPGDTCTDNGGDTGLIGIIIAGYTGIIIAGRTDDTPQACGIIIAG